MIYYRFHHSKMIKFAPVNDIYMMVKEFKQFLVKKHRLSQRKDIDLVVLNGEGKTVGDDNVIMNNTMCVVKLLPNHVTGNLYLIKEPPRVGYVCRRCNIPGHLISDCSSFLKTRSYRQKLSVL